MFILVVFEYSYTRLDLISYNPALKIKKYHIVLMTEIIQILHFLNM